MTKQITINGSLIEDIPSFYAEVNRVFMHSETWEIGNSLDALDDLLFGGFGAIAGSEPIELHWTHIAKSRRMLGFQVTKAYYTQKLEPGSPFNKTLFAQKLAELETGAGETYFDMVIAVIAGHPNIQLIAS